MPSASHGRRARLAAAARTTPHRSIEPSGVAWARRACRARAEGARGAWVRSRVDLLSVVDPTRKPRTRGKRLGSDCAEALYASYADAFPLLGALGEEHGRATISDIFGFDGAAVIGNALIDCAVHQGSKLKFTVQRQDLFGTGHLCSPVALS